MKLKQETLEKLSSGKAAFPETVMEKIDRVALEADLRREVDGEVRFDSGSRALYATDGSNYRQVPLGVVIPRSTAAVERTIAICHRHDAPVVSRGGGTALAGQGCNVAVVIDFSKYLNRVLEIDPERKLARVQPGTILDELRGQTEREHGLTFGPDPATHDHCTFGGMIGNNSCGVHSVMAGRTADNIHELEILTYDGERLRVGPTSDEELEKIIAEGGRRGQIYGELRDLRDRHAETIRARYPKIPRRVSGYNLDNLLPENGFNVARALVGSEGSCITILEATVNLIDHPPARTLLVLGYPDVYSAGDHVTEIMEHGPIGLEGIDDLLIDFMQRKGLNLKDLQLLPDGGGWLLVEFGGLDKQDSDRKAEETMSVLKKSKHPPHMKLYTDSGEEQMVWEIRESGLGATAHVPGMPKCWSGWEDAAVPPARVGDYLRDFRALLNKYEYQASLYGHFGQGCIHCRISFDLFTHEGIEKYMAFIEGAADLVNSYGGTFSGEHGDGQSKAKFLPKIYGEDLMQAFMDFKKIWDPDWRMNPGKIVRAYDPDQNLRLGTDYSPLQPETQFKFPADEGSFSAATLRCVGVGKCRRTHDAFMCPSFLVTREEKDTTRGRAHLLFEMFKGEVITDFWQSKEVLDSLDLCLACKGCKDECPVSVDMATYKSEFLYHHYQDRLRPAHAYAMGLIGYWGAMGARLPQVANYVSQTPVLKHLFKLAGGVSPQRELPAFADQSFCAWFAQRQGAEAEGGEDVVLYPDVFNNYFYPGILKAALELLEEWGYRVHVPPGPPPAVRPEIHYGMLDLAKSHLRKEIDRLAPYVRQGVPVVVLEPSTAAVFRDELPALFVNNHDGQRLTLNTYLLSEFIMKGDLPLPELQGNAIFHAHCHQKAVLDAGAGRKVLKKLGLVFEEPQPGCCGMAGSFGFERDHYEMSMGIGEENLLPAVRSADRTTYIVADGFSCRTQISQGTSRRPMHLAELILHARRSKAGVPRAYPERLARRERAPVLSHGQVGLVGAALIGGVVLARYLVKKRE